MRSSHLPALSWFICALYATILTASPKDRILVCHQWSVQPMQCGKVPIAKFNHAEKASGDVSWSNMCQESCLAQNHNRVRDKQQDGPHLEATSLLTSRTGLSTDGTTASEGIQVNTLCHCLQRYFLTGSCTFAHPVHHSQTLKTSSC